MNPLLESILRASVNNLIIFILFFIPREKANKSILIVKVDALGDFVIFLPSLIEYKKLFPGYLITVTVGNKVTYTIAQRYIGKEIDGVILLDDRKFTRNFFYRLSYAIKIYKKHFKEVHYPAYFRRFIGDAITLYTRANKTVAFAGHRIEINNSRVMSSHYDIVIPTIGLADDEFYRNKIFLENISKKYIEKYEPTFPIQGRDLEKAKTILPKTISAYSYVCIFPGAGLPIKIWPKEKFATVADHLANKGYNVVFCGTQQERSLSHEIILLTKGQNMMINICGETDVFTLAAIFKNSKLYFGSDTGPLHIAAGIGIPTICILGKGAFKQFFPYGDLNKNKIIFDKDSHCENDEWACSKNLPPGSPAPCIKNISTKDALVTIDTLLK